MSAPEAEVVNLEAEAIKERGNVAFKGGDFETALSLYGEAVDMDPSNSKYLINRSLCFASMNRWDKSYEDAKLAVSLAPKAQKAHFRLIKAMFELANFKGARLALLNAIKECGESKEMKSLEDELLTRTGIPLRPKSTDFEIVGELGDGNFSKVYKARHKATDRLFAIKTIEKMTIDRMKKRHGNINNEILMEKRALHRLEHTGIVQLYNTFQDYGTLYYQMEYIGGRDLWDRLHEVQLTGFLSSAGENTSGENAPHAQVGCHWSLARFYLAEAINAVEHMHQRGIAHRDIKPENMIITESGHLKFVDFGTAKDFIQTDLNGPEFVGTPEYLSPATVRNCTCGIEVDLWALGVVFFQMLLGYTPFGAPSPYLTFLRIKRSFLQIPNWVPAPLASMLQLLLQPDAKARLRSACGASLSDTAGSSNKLPTGINYDALRGHEMFTNAHSIIAAPPSSTAVSAGVDGSNIASTATDELSTVAGVRTVYDRPALRVPTLRELCLRATGRATLLLAAATAENGGVRPTEPKWMQTFNLLKLSALDRAQIQHYLVRQQRLHTPGVYRLFCTSLVEARSRRSDPSTGEYLGLTRLLQGHWDKDFHFLQLASPMFGTSDVSSSDAAAVASPDSQLKELISAVNKLRPKFLVMIGNFTHSVSAPTTTATATATTATTGASGDIYNQQVEAFRKTMARLSDTIPAVYCPGSHDVGTIPTPATLHAYRQRFGADYFGFWYGGMRGLVINSSLLINPSGAPEEAARQEIWLTEEIEQSKLCSNNMIVFSYHPWFVSDMEEADSDVTVAPGVGADGSGNAISGDVIRTFPLALRRKWLKTLRHHKVKLAISSCAGRVSLDCANTSTAANAGTTTTTCSNNANSGNAAAAVLRPFPARRGGKGSKSRQAEMEAEAEEDNNNNMAVDIEAYSADWEPPKPSEIIARALASGELSTADVSPPPSSTSISSAAEEQQATVLPPAPPSEVEVSAAEMNRLSVESAEHSTDSVSGADVKAEEEGSDSDRESDYAAAEEGEGEKAEEVFLNEDEDCEGPEVLHTPGLMVEVASTAVAGAGAATVSGVAGLRAVLVQEYEVKHQFFPLAALPKTMADLLDTLN